MIQKVAIYIRVSTLDQARNGYSLAAQRKTLEDYATLHGYEVVHVYADEGISGKDISHRPAVREISHHQLRSCIAPTCPRLVGV